MWPPKPPAEYRAMREVAKRNPPANGPQYRIRLVLCDCGTTTYTNTADKQMWHMKEGMRAIVCTGCHKQSRTHRWKCACDIAWHKCPEHKVDPLEHKTKRTERVKKDQHARVALLSTRRPKPEPKLKLLGTRHTSSKGNLNKCFKKLLEKPWKLSGKISSYGLSKAACPKLYRKFACTAHRPFYEGDEEDVSERDYPMSHPHQEMPPDGRETHLLNSETGVRGSPTSGMLASDSRSCGTVLLPRRGSSVRLESKAPPSPYSGQGECQANN